MSESSKLFDNALEQFCKLPGIGKKSALRIVLFLIHKDPSFLNAFLQDIELLHSGIQFCSTCYHLSDADICHICSSSFRKKNIICVVENIKDVISIESTDQYNGVYHVLGGLISPIDGIGPDKIKVGELIHRIEKQAIDEIIFALSPTIPGDTTTFYIQKEILKKHEHILFTTLARGISFGGNLEYADEITLGKSIQNRLPLEKYLKT